jgi:hypothetical protein
MEAVIKGVEVGDEGHEESLGRPCEPAMPSFCIMFSRIFCICGSRRNFGFCRYVFTATWTIFLQPIHARHRIPAMHPICSVSYSHRPRVSCHFRPPSIVCSVISFLPSTFRSIPWPPTHHLNFYSVLPFLARSTAPHPIYIHPSPMILCTKRTRLLQCD